MDGFKDAFTSAVNTVGEAAGNLDEVKNAITSAVSNVGDSAVVAETLDEVKNAFGTAVSAVGEVADKLDEWATLGIRIDQVTDLEERLKRAEKNRDWKCLSIYKYNLSAWAKKHQYKRVSVPQVVSLGPYHSEDERLKTKMYIHKERALNHFWKSSGKTLMDYLLALQQVRPQLMDAYESLDLYVLWERVVNNFLLLILIDGCFMLEILRANASITSPGDTYGDYGGEEDPIFSYHGKANVMPYIRRDMLMLENQIPMLALIILVKIESKIEGDPMKYLNQLILKFVCPNLNCPPHDEVKESLHVLDLYRNTLLGLESDKDRSMVTISIPSTDSDHRRVRSAEKLHQAGVTFEPTGTTSLSDISFDQGILKLPCIIVDDISESTFFNLMAFERAHAGLGNAVTSFVAFMRTIITSPNDVSILNESRIISNPGLSEKAVADIFCRISEDVAIDSTGRLSKILDEINRYCSTGWKRRLNEHIIFFKDTYFKSPWTAISLVAATFLLFLTVIQTVYAVITYHTS